MSYNIRVAENKNFWPVNFHAHTDFENLVLSKLTIFKISSNLSKMINSCGDLVEKLERLENVSAIHAHDFLHILQHMLLETFKRYLRDEILLDSQTNSKNRSGEATLHANPSWWLNDEKSIEIDALKCNIKQSFLADLNSLEITKLNEFMSYGFSVNFLNDYLSTHISPCLKEIQILDFNGSFEYIRSSIIQEARLALSLSDMCPRRFPSLTFLSVVLYSIAFELNCKIPKGLLQCCLQFVVQAFYSGIDFTDRKDDKVLNIGNSRIIALWFWILEKDTQGTFVLKTPSTSKTIALKSGTSLIYLCSGSSYDISIKNGKAYAITYFITGPDTGTYKWLKK